MCVKFYSAHTTLLIVQIILLLRINNSFIFSHFFLPRDPNSREFLEFNCGQNFNNIVIEIVDFQKKPPFLKEQYGYCRKYIFFLKDLSKRFKK